MPEIRLGRQTPTISVVQPYTQSRGQEAVELYNKSKRKAQEWQELQLEDMMAVDDDGLWIHIKYGYSVPRRNGKSEILTMRMMWSLTHGRRTLYTAHRATTSSDMWGKCCDRLAEIGYIEGVDYKTTKKYGLETIEWLKDDTGAVIKFRTRSSKGGLGEGYDDLIIDEAQEYTLDQASALKYIVTDSKNPQTIMCGTPTTAVSSGTVFMEYRKETLSGAKDTSGWAEWSVPQLTDAHDPELWYETNPSLGYILSERTIKDELGNDQVDDNIQRLGLWLTYSQKSAISRREWESYIVKDKPVLKTPIRLFFGVKYAKATSNVSLSVAVKTNDDKVFVEAIDCRSIRDGNDWIITYLRSANAKIVAIDGAGNQEILSSQLRDAGVKCRIVLPKVADIITANALFERQLFGDCIRHCGQPSLTQAISNADHRSIGSSGGYGYISLLDGADVSLVESISLAHWLCATTKEPKKQLVRY